MQWLNINVSTIDAEPFAGAEPIDRATWLCLQRYCVGQENGGIIVDCVDWADRKWQQLVMVTKAEVERTSALWRFEGNNLILWRYPIEQERTMDQRREVGKLSARKRWGKRMHQLNNDGLPKPKRSRDMASATEFST